MPVVHPRTPAGRLLPRVFSCLRASNTSAQSAVEMAMTVPILLLIVTGITTFGLAFNNYVLLTQATSVGARQFAINRSEGGDSCALAATAIANAAPLLANTGPVSGIGYTFTVYTTTSTSVTYNSSPPTCNSATLTQGQAVTVATTYPCVLKVYRVNYIPSCFLKAQTTEIIQ